ncbi:MAG: ribonuclease HII [Candidatus Zixiibacteriota bacterium]|nr:MAG: ribonuclease HII [candidate division Zixibacteria bacterium]
MKNKLTDTSDFSYNQIEEMLRNKGCQFICGVDEVGRGPLAGPVVAAAVILPEDLELDGLDDSKKLSPVRRNKIFEQIINSDTICAIGIIDNESIDKINILKASLMAMRKAVMDLKKAPDFVIVDGTFPIPKLDYPQFAVVKGDSRCRSIAAASVVAKVTRDRIMEKYDAMYPGFSFSKHKGYPTAEHIEELRREGPCDIHRKSFKPVAEILNQYALF